MERNNRGARNGQPRKCALRWLQPGTDLPAEQKRYAAVLTSVQMKNISVPLQVKSALRWLQAGRDPCAEQKRYAAVLVLHGMAGIALR